MCSGLEMFLIGTTALGAIAEDKRISKQIEVDMENAQISEQAAIINAQIRRKQSERLVAEQRVAFLNSGVILEGTPEDVIVETVRDEELDALAILHSGQLDAAAHRQSAESRVGQRQGVIFEAIGKGASMTLLDT